MNLLAAHLRQLAAEATHPILGSYVRRERWAWRAAVLRLFQCELGEPRFRGATDTNCRVRRRVAQ